MHRSVSSSTALVGVFIVLIAVFFPALPAQADILEKQCVILSDLLYAERECVSAIPFCGEAWPFGWEETQLWEYEKWCQWWLCDPYVGWLCTPVGEAWLEDTWQGTKVYFRGCGCNPGGDPIPCNLGPESVGTEP